MTQMVFLKKRNALKGGDLNPKSYIKKKIKIYW